jgi:hypothetical protein
VLSILTITTYSNLVALRCTVIDISNETGEVMGAARSGGAARASNPRQSSRPLSPLSAPEPIHQTSSKKEPGNTLATSPHRFISVPGRCWFAA